MDGGLIWLLPLSFDVGPKVKAEIIPAPWNPQNTGRFLLWVNCLLNKKNVSQHSAFMEIQMNLDIKTELQQTVFLSIPLVYFNSEVEKILFPVCYFIFVITKNKSISGALCHSSTS